MAQVTEALRTPGEAVKAFLASHGVIVFVNPDTLLSDKLEFNQEGNRLQVRDHISPLDQAAGREARELDLVVAEDHVSAMPYKSSASGQRREIGFPLREVTGVDIGKEDLIVVGKEMTGLGPVEAAIKMDYSRGDFDLKVLPSSQRR